MNVLKIFFFFFFFLQRVQIRCGSCGDGNLSFFRAARCGVHALQRQLWCADPVRDAVVGGGRVVPVPKFTSSRRFVDERPAQSVRCIVFRDIASHHNTVQTRFGLCWRLILRTTASRAGDALRLDNEISARKHPVRWCCGVGTSS